MSELEFNELLVQFKEKFERYQRRKKLRWAAEQNCEWWHFISEEQQDYILNSCIEICDILEKTVIPVFCEIWERLKDCFSAISESMHDFAKIIEEMQAEINAADDRKKTTSFFECKKEKNEKIKKFTPPEKQKFRKWRYSVYGHHR